MTTLADRQRQQWDLASGGSGQGVTAEEERHRKRMADAQNAYKASQGPQKTSQPVNSMEMSRKDDPWADMDWSMFGPQAAPMSPPSAPPAAPSKGYYQFHGGEVSNQGGGNGQVHAGGTPYFYDTEYGGGGPSDEVLSDVPNNETTYGSRKPGGPEDEENMGPPGSRWKDRKTPHQEHTGGPQTGVDPTKGTPEEGGPEGGDGTTEVGPPPEEDAENFDPGSGGGDGPMSEDYWTDFMDRFSGPQDLDFGQVSAGNPRQQNPEVDAFQKYLMDQAKKHMNNPSRYDSELVRKGMQVVDDQIAEMRRTGTSAIASQAAQRGLTGSSLEASNQRLFEADLDRTANERAFALQQDQARTWAQDRSSAFNMGLGAGQQAMTRDQQLMDQDLRNRALDLQAQGMNQDMALQTAQLEFQMNEAAASMGLDREAMLLDEDYRQKELDLRERGLDADDAQWQAEMAWKQEAFEKEFNLDLDKMDAQERQHAMNLITWATTQGNFTPEEVSEWLKRMGYTTDRRSEREEE